MKYISRLPLISSIAGLAIVPVACHAQASTDGRSIATLSKVMVKSRSGAAVPLGSRISPGKPTVISIWASWCPPCVVEAPYLNQLRKRLGDRFNFIYVNRREGNPDTTQPPEAVARFLTRGGMSDVDYVVADVPAYRRIVAGDLAAIPDGKVGIPRVYLFDAKGRQTYTAYGFQEADGPALERRVREAIGK